SQAGCSAPLVASNPAWDRSNVIRDPTVSCPVCLFTLTRVAKGGESALLTTRSTPSSGSKASSSARRLSPPPVETSLICVGGSVLRSKETTRLDASVTNSQCPDATTPLGPDRSLSATKPGPLGFGLRATPLNAGLALICITNVFVFALMTSTLALERSAR